MIFILLSRQLQTPICDSFIREFIWHVTKSFLSLQRLSLIKHVWKPVSDSYHRKFAIFYRFVFHYLYKILFIGFRECEFMVELLTPLEHQFGGVRLQVRRFDFFIISRAFCENWALYPGRFQYLPKLSLVYQNLCVILLS